jgi:hypothetical protein
MRKLLVLSVLTILSAAASGCCGRNPCGSWRPGQYLFGAGRAPQPAAVPCCDPCADPCAGAAVMPAMPVMAPAAVPCCQ